MTTIRVTDRHRGTVIARSGVLVGVRMTVLPDLPDIGLISLGDRVSDDQPLRTVFSRLVKEGSIVRRHDGMATTRGWLRHALIAVSAGLHVVAMASSLATPWRLPIPAMDH